MPRKPISKTAFERLPRAEQESPRYRREVAIRSLIAKHGDPLAVLAQLMAESSDPKIKADAAKALARYCYPELKAVEMSGPGGERLTVEIRRASPPVAPQATPEPPATPGTPGPQ